MANLYNIHVRTGCFCNTGACQSFLGITNQRVKRNLQVRDERKRKLVWKLSLLRACVGRMKRLSLSFSLQGRPRLWRQHRHSGWPADRICSSVLRLHVNIWRLSKVPELCGGVLRRETRQSRPREATGVEKSCCSVRGLQWISFNPNY